MASIAINKKVHKGRTFVRVAVTPKSAETRALLRRFQTEVKEFEKKWKATKAYRAANAKKAKKKKAAKK
jgi:hypothetical protein